MWRHETVALQMSKSTLKRLQAISFLTKDNSVADLQRIPPSEIAGRLRYYHEQRTQSADQEAAEIVSSQLRDSAFLSSVSAANAVMALGPKLLVHQALIVDDPLFDFAAPTHEHTKVARESMGMSSDDGVDLAKLHNKLLYFSELAPLIEAGFLHTIPVSLLHTGPDVIPVNAPKNLYRERVPADAVDFVFDSVLVRPMERTPEGIIILDEPNHRRCRQISITFKDDDAASHASFYHFREVKFHGENPDGPLKVSWKAWCDDPLDEAQYAIWEEQVINQTVGARLDAVAKEMRLAQVLGAPYLTESNFEAELLSRSGVQRKAMQIHWP
jgi:hypothetical protein